MPVINGPLHTLVPRDILTVTVNVIPLKSNICFSYCLIMSYYITNKTLTHSIEYLNALPYVLFKKV